MILSRILTAFRRRPAATLAALDLDGLSQHRLRDLGLSRHDLGNIMLLAEIERGVRR